MWRWVAAALFAAVTAALVWTMRPPEPSEEGYRHALKLLRKSD